jgi:hypothetical protein
MPRNDDFVDIKSIVSGVEEPLKQAYTNTVSTYGDLYRRGKKYAGEVVQKSADYYGGVAKKLGSEAVATTKDIASKTAGTLAPIPAKTGAALAPAAKTMGRQAAALPGIVEPSNSAWRKTVISDKQRTEDENRALKNPFEATDFTGQSQALGGKMQRLNADERYQKMSPAERVKTREKIYDQMVVPMFQQAGKPPPSKKDWLMNTRSDVSMAGQDITMGAVRQGYKIALAGAQYERKVWAIHHGIADFFHGDTAFDFDASIRKGEWEANRGIWGRAVKNLEPGLNHTNFFINSRPRDSMLSSAGIWTGEQLVQLPMYALGGKVLGAGVEAASGITAGEGLVGSIPGMEAVVSLTKAMAATPTGRWAGRRLLNAADGYLSSRLVGETHKEGVQSGVGFAAFGAVSEPLVAGWKTMAKKFTGNNIAVGGKELQHELTESAMATLRGKGKPVDMKEDPINHKMHQVEMQVVSDIAQHKYGKPFKDLTTEEQHEVAATRAQYTAETADGLPHFVPDLVHEEAAAELTEQRKNSPILDKHAKALEQAGVKLSEVVAEERIHTAEAQAGIVNPTSAAEKVSKVEVQNKVVASDPDNPVTQDLKASKKAKATEGEKEYEPKEGESVTLNPKEFAGIHSDARAFYRNSGKRVDTMGRLIGARDQRTVGERIKDDNADKFIEFLNDIDGGKIPFESDQQRMIWHWGFRKDMTTPFKDKLRRQIDNNFQKAKLPKPDAAELNLRHKNLMKHLTYLLHSGRLANGEVVFNSTKTAGRRTEHQLALEDEVAQKTVRQVKRHIKNTPGGETILDPYVGLVNRE